MTDVEEVRVLAGEFDDEDLNRYLALAPKGMSKERIAFIAASTADDSDEEGWRKIFAACNGKTEKECIEIAQAMTT